MNKAELVAAMAEKTELSKKDAEAALKAFTDVVAEELKKSEFVCGGDGCEEKSNNSVCHHWHSCYKYNDYIFNI